MSKVGKFKQFMDLSHNLLYLEPIELNVLPWKIAYHYCCNGLATDNLTFVQLHPDGWFDDFLEFDSIFTYFLTDNLDGTGYGHVDSYDPMSDNIITQSFELVSFDFADLQQAKTFFTQQRQNKILIFRHLSKTINLENQQVNWKFWVGMVNLRLDILREYKLNAILE